MGANASPVALSRVAGATLSAVVVLVTSAVLTPSQRGELAALQTAAVLLAAVGGGSLALGISVVVGRQAEAARAAAVLAVAEGLALGGVLVAIGLAARGALGLTSAAALATAGAAGALAAYGALQGIPIGLARLRDYARADVLRAAAALAAVAAGLAAGARRPAALLALWTIGAVLGALSLASVRSRARNASPNPHTWRDLAREALRRSLKAHPTNLVGLAVARLDVVVLAAVSTRPQVAYYSLAVVIAEAAWLVPSALAVTAQSDYVRGDARQARDAARRAARRSVGAAGATGVVAGAGGVAVILAFLPDAYHASLAPLWIVLAGTIPYSVGHVASPYLVTAVDRPRTATAIATATLAADLAILAVLGGPLGAIGAAVASTAAYALNAALNVRALSRGAGRPAGP